jgi:hypothetical protein
MDALFKVAFVALFAVGAVYFSPKVANGVIYVTYAVSRAVCLGYFAAKNVYDRVKAQPKTGEKQ